MSRPSVIIDNGSYCCKAGFSCDNHPVSIIKTTVGRPKDRIGFYGKGYYDVYIGDEAIKVKDYDLHSPVVRGKIVHWDNMERVWHHVFYRELKVAPEEQSVVLSVATKTDLKDKVKCCEVFFENLNAPAMSIQSQSITALYGSGFTTGLTVDLGYDSTDVNPIYEGGNIAYAHIDTHLCGRDIHNYIVSNLEKRGMFLGAKQYDIVADIKKKSLFITPEPSDVCHRIKYMLPDGKEIDLSEEIHSVSDMIFRPELVLGKDTKVMPLHTAVITAALKCDGDLRDDLYSAVVPTGGLSATPGLIRRLQYEMETAVDRPVNVVESSETYCLNWLGAAIFAGMNDVEKVWVKKKQFEEYGEKIVRNKFL